MIFDLDHFDLGPFSTDCTSCRSMSMVVIDPIGNEKASPKPLLLRFLLLISATDLLELVNHGLIRGLTCLSAGLLLEISNPGG